MVRFNIPQRLSSKLKPRILNASEIIIMRACVPLLAASVSLSLTICVCVNIHCAGRMLKNLWITVWSQSANSFHEKEEFFSYMHKFTDNTPTPTPFHESHLILFSNTFSSSQTTATFISAIIEPARAIISIHHESGQQVDMLSQSSSPAAKSTHAIQLCLLSTLFLLRISPQSVRGSLD